MSSLEIGRRRIEYADGDWREWVVLAVPCTILVLVAWVCFAIALVLHFIVRGIDWLLP